MKNETNTDAKFRARRLVLMLRWAALNSDLRGKDYRVLLALLGQLRTGEYVRISQLALSEELDITPPHVSKAVKHLVESGILELKDRTSGWKNVVRLAAYSEDELKEKIEEILDERSDCEED